MAAEWKQGLFNCCGDCGICCCGTFCDCCLVYQNADNLGKSGLLCCLLACMIPCVPTMILRNEARERWGIQGSTGGDFCASVCCYPCVDCQTAVEIKERGAQN
ncbi:cornifelin [Eurytemora carolleeae]|uniref:cornifelin n=1 Tax=Eurytemora carolleeae TaxID=1294199 RepID=UPI000C793048|nr:cornifelin [Eurytemora carolleeae]|eukprot:XP_023339378.1 cornifelin-like [Eurytemora affinis]